MKIVTRGTFHGRAPMMLIGDHLAYTERSGFVITVKELDAPYKEVAKLQGHTMIVNAIAKLGERIVTAGWDKSVKIWDVTNNTCLASVEVDDYVTALCAQPQTDCVFVGGGGGFMAKLKYSP